MKSAIKKNFHYSRSKNELVLEIIALNLTLTWSFEEEKKYQVVSANFIAISLSSRISDNLTLPSYIRMLNFSDSLFISVINITEQKKNAREIQIVKEILMSHACLHRHSITTHNNREDNLVSQSQQQSVGARIHKVGHWCGREINKKKEERRKKSLPDPKKERATAIILTLCMLSTLSPIQYLYDVFRLYTKKIDVYT